MSLPLPSGRRYPLVPALLALLTACGGDASGPDGGTRIELTGTSGPLEEGETRQLRAAVRDGAGNPIDTMAISWSSSEPAVATVSGAGVVTGVSAGTARIRATAGGAFDTASVLVVPASVASITLLPFGDTLPVAVPVTLVAELRDQRGHLITGRTVSFTSGSPGLLTVTPAGQATIFARGAATLVIAVNGAETTRPLTGLGTFVRYFPSAYASCAVDSLGAAWCWGPNGVGQLGRGTTTDDGFPGPVAGGLHFSRLARSRDHACGLASGAAYCWGDGSSGSLGDGGPMFLATPRTTPAPVVGAHTFLDIATSPERSCGLDDAGVAWCWGGYVTSTPAPVSSPVPLTTLAVGINGSACGLDAGGMAYCQGEGRLGQLATGDTLPRAAFTPISGGLTFAEIGTTGEVFCGRTPVGAVYCWGLMVPPHYNAVRIVLTPIPIPGLAATRLAVGSSHACALDASQEVWCWGRGGFGQPTASQVYPEPVRLGGGLHFTTLASGFAMSCGRATNGFDYCWGAGALGNGMLTSSTSFPVRVIIR